MQNECEEIAVEANDVLYVLEMMLSFMLGINVENRFNVALTTIDVIFTRPYLRC